MHADISVRVHPRLRPCAKVQKGQNTNHEADSYADDAGQKDMFRGGFLGVHFLISIPDLRFNDQRDMTEEHSVSLRKNGREM